MVGRRNGVDTGIGRPRRKIRAWNCGKPLERIDHNESHRPRSLHAKLQIDAFDRRIGVLEAPAGRLDASGIGRLAKIVAVDAGAEDFYLREAEVKDAPWRGDAMWR